MDDNRAAEQLAIGNRQQAIGNLANKYVKQENLGPIVIGIVVMVIGLSDSKLSLW